MPSCSIAAVDPGTAQVTTHTKRRSCPRCGRPERVCLCPALPPAPLMLSGSVVILQHPHEQRRRLATVPVLVRCLDASCLHVVVTRRAVPGRSLQLDALLADAHARGMPALVLWPGPGVRCIEDVVSTRVHQQQRQQAHTGKSRAQQPRSAVASSQPAAGHRPGSMPAEPPPASPPPLLLGGQYLLIVLDGTWQQAKEMFAASSPWLLPRDGSGPGLQVQLRGKLMPAGAGAAAAAGASAAAAALAVSSGAHQATLAEAVCHSPDAHCRLRTEPHEDCCTTYEAIARALACLEGAEDVTYGAKLLETLMAPLRLMTAHQAAFDPSVRARCAPGGYCVANSRTRLGTLLDARRSPELQGVLTTAQPQPQAVDPCCSRIAL